MSLVFAPEVVACTGWLGVHGSLDRSRSLAALCGDALGWPVITPCCPCLVAWWHQSVWGPWRHCLGAARGLVATAYPAPIFLGVLLFDPGAGPCWVAWWPGRVRIGLVVAHFSLGGERHMRLGPAN